MTPRELSVRAASQLGRSIFTPTLETALTLPDAGARAIASDDGTGHSLDTIELGDVLAKTRKLLGKPLDLLGMDACLMSCLEVAFQSAADVRAVVSSEELEPGDGWPYDKLLADLRSDPGMDGAGLGRVIVKRYIESYKTRTDQWPVTMCAVHSAGIEAFSDKLDAFTMELRRAIKDDDVDATRLLRAHTRSVRFDGDLIDLKTFCEQVRSQPFASPVKTAAKKVLDALEAGRLSRRRELDARPEGRALRRRDRLPAGADGRDLALLQGPALRPAPRLGRVPALLQARRARRVALHAGQLEHAPDRLGAVQHREVHAVQLGARLEPQREPHPADVHEAQVGQVEHHRPAAVVQDGVHPPLERGDRRAVQLAVDRDVRRLADARGVGTEALYVRQGSASCVMHCDFWSCGCGRAGGCAVAASRSAQACACGSRRVRVSCCRGARRSGRECGSRLSAASCGWAPGARLGERAVVVSGAGVEIGARAVVGDWAAVEGFAPTFSDVERPVRVQPVVAGADHDRGGRGGRAARGRAVCRWRRAAVVEPYAVLGPANVNTSM